MSLNWILKGYLDWILTGTVTGSMDLDLNSSYKPSCKSASWLVGWLVRRSVFNDFQQKALFYSVISKIGHKPVGKCFNNIEITRSILISHRDQAQQIISRFLNSILNYMDRLELIQY